ncbi:glycosyltransferase family 4 protein [Phormidium sp. LEGE 05292]|uniref:glycosyltransferase family 4 protein n=1 Tax=[Phormidium] sp. LEGE 05292 TaxID=767427 RepID=UPI00187F67E3|nr:glycosyltransferase family 4 protein [Phormidium sp. LEGE 05292]MBE9228318.1 glycosyltransferase family 4 protein [Phormidium sp. LEGE 05292]
MRILHLMMHENTGSGRAATRLNMGLVQLGQESSILTGQKRSNSDLAIGTKFITSTLKEIQFILVNKFLNQKLSSPANVFSINITPSRLLKQIKTLNPDIINLHWIGWEFLKIEDLKKLQVPLVWTFHDMWAFTGGCHYSANCDRYTKSCGACPQLQSIDEQDLSHWIWKRKAKAWQDLNITVVSPSHWLAECAKRSSLFQNMRIEVIPNGLDTQIYKPLNREIARDRLNLPQNKSLVLFGAMHANGDPRKGLHFLQPALQKLSTTDWQDQMELIIFGASKPINAPDFGFKTHYLGNLTDDITLSLIYAAGDVFVAPSMQDNLPNTVMEALASGTPTVAFNIGGMPDLINHQQTGYLAKPYEVDDLTRGICWVLEDLKRYRSLSQQARETVVQNFTLQQQAICYLSLYKKILADSGRGN